MKKMKVVIVILAAALSALAAIARAQEMVGETKSEVPELTAFHEVIYPIWHTAYPDKDYKALRGYVPQINELAAKIYAAKLPGILREKEAKWKDGVAQLKKSVDDYNAAAAGKDDQALLNAAETLHAKYEALVRVLMPVLKEVDDFHQALYVIYHKYAPDKLYDKIREAAPGLAVKAGAVTKAQLPARLSSKADVYQKAALELAGAADELKTAAENHDHEGMLKGVDKVHAKYQALVKIFE
jgi:hypothetical protein